MKRRHTCQESEEKWKKLLALSQLTKQTTTDNNNNNKNDLFDCQSMVAPTTRALVDDVLEEFAAKWRALDDRRICQDSSIVTTKQDDDSKQILPLPKKRKYRRGGWEHTQEQLLTLPPNFDYATLRDRPPSPTCYEDKVIDLLNPTKQDSYHQELWKLFSQIPTVEDLTETARAHTQLPHTLALQQEITEGTQKVQRMDAHGLGRLRMAHRHGLPPPTATGKFIGTLRLEFWRRQPKRGSGPDARRMVLEFASSQTLLDVHKAIASMTEDDGWTSQNDTTEGGLFFIEEKFYTTHGETTSRQEESAVDGNKNANNGAPGTSTDHNQRSSGNDTGGNAAEARATAASGDNSNDTATSNTTTASNSGVDYMIAITQWLDGGGIPNPTRRQYLGIATSNRFRQGIPMKDAILDKIPFRLGVRYYHVMHGDVECSVMVTDKRLVPANPKTKYPIIHDIWTPNYPVPICEACDRFAAIYVYFHRGTAAANYQDGDPTAVCENCCQALKLLEKEKDALQLYHVWKNKSELSTAMIRSEQCRFF